MHISFITFQLAALERIAQNNFVKFKILMVEKHCFNHFNIYNITLLYFFL